MFLNFGTMKKILLLLLAIAMFTLSACDEDQGHELNRVTITILHPTADQEISIVETQTDSVNIHVRFEWDGDEGESVDIRLWAQSQNNDVIIDFDQHQHNKVFEFQQAVNLSSYPAGTQFQLEIFACEDHDCNSWSVLSQSFRLVE
jgi:hypothetical protein